MVMGWIRNLIGLASGFALPTWLIPVAAAVLVTGFVTTVFVYGYNAGQARVQAQQFAAEKARLEKLIAQRDAALRQNDQIAEAQEKEIAAMETQIEELTRDVQNPGIECLDAGDVNRLRQLFGGPR